MLNVVKRQRIKSRTRSLGSRNDADLFLSFSLSLLKLLRPMKQFYAHYYCKTDYAQDDIVFMKVNKLTSTKTQLPYDYYTMPYCKPNPIVYSAENLGEVLRGDRIENSLYSLEMRNDMQCSVVCKIDSLSEQQTKDFETKIEEEYRVNMILDNLPVAMVKIRATEDGEGETVERKTYERGYPVGFKASVEEGGEEKSFLHNHLRFTILYHKDQETDLSRIVGFEVEPFSVKHEFEEPWDDVSPTLTTCNPGRMQYVTHGLAPQIVEEGSEVIFSYDVLYKQSDIRWASRWDTYLLMVDDQIHWFSIINSMMIVLFLSGMVALIMLRTLHRDISRYNQLETSEEAQEESGWKLVHGDVFRTPEASGLLAVHVGTGVQILACTFVTLAFAILGFLSPANRGGLGTAMVLLFTFMGFLNGYVSGVFYKIFKGPDWKGNAGLAAMMFPGVLFGVFTFLNFFIWTQKSSGAIPFGTFFILVFLWFGISIPLVYAGAWFATKKEIAEDPVRTNKIPRQIPEQPWYMSGAVSILTGGILPFGAVFIELFFILTSIWLQQFYYVFGFLALVVIILLITCAEITIVLTYFQLCNEDYRWWWRSFHSSGSSAFYLFAYGTIYFFTKLEITKKVPTMMYFGYMGVVSYGFYILTGSIGFLASYAFVRTIYSSVKID